MDPITAAAAINTAITLIQVLAPKVEAMCKDGQISKEEQDRIRAQFDALRNHAAFTGPEWEVAP